MTDDTPTITNADAPAVAETTTAPKKQRKPRNKKPSTKTAATSAATKSAVGVDGVTSRKKRGRNPNVVEDAAVTKRSYVKRAAKDHPAATVEALSAGDEMADVLVLEEENRKLRKLLSEKLRAENADLRNKLKLP